jgi:hypothetical protein
LGNFSFKKNIEPHSNIENIACNLGNQLSLA